MKQFILIFSLLSTFSTTSLGQTIPKFKSDADCLKFIQSIKGFKDFYFDSVFTKAECTNLNPVFKFWQLLDFNKDKKPDLLFTGAFRDDYYKSKTVAIYLSDAESYKIVPLVLEEGRTSFRPHVFVNENMSKPLIIVQNYHFSEFEKVEDLIIKDKLQRWACEGDDTLMFSNGTLLNYFSRPSNIIFDSITLVNRHGGSCRKDSFILFRNGDGRHFTGCSQEIWRSQNFHEEAINIAYLTNLVLSIDVNQMRKLATIGWTDNPSATFSIYHKGIKYSFDDYGLQSSFTLKAIYQYFSDLSSEL